MINKLILFLILILSHYAVIGQDATENTSEELTEVPAKARLFEVTFDLTKGVGSFGRNIDKDLNGFSIAYLMQSDSKNYSFFGLQYSRYSLGSLTEAVNDNGAFFTDRSSTILNTAHLVFRQFTPFFYKGIEPFVEVALGPQLIYTGTNTSFLDGDVTRSDFTFEQSDFGLSYGLSAGFTCKVYTQFFLSLKAGYYSGTASTYMVPQDEVTTLYPIDSFSLRSGQLSYFKFQIGAAYSY